MKLSDEDLIKKMCITVCILRHYGDKLDCTEKCHWCHETHVMCLDCYKRIIENAS